MEFYLKEAFQSLKLLEDDFNLTADQGVIDELQSFVADDIEAPAEEQIIDVEADEVEDLQDNYVGKVILECDCCHTRIYKDKEDVIIDEETGLANVEEECPVCSNAFGWNVIGKIEPFKEGEFDDEPEEVDESKVEIEFSDDEVSAAIKESLNEACDEEKCEEDCDKDLEEKCDESLKEDFEDLKDVGVDPDTAVEDDVRLETPMENPVVDDPAIALAEELKEEVIDEAPVDPELKAGKPEKVGKWEYSVDKNALDKAMDTIYNKLSEEEFKLLNDNALNAYIDKDPEALKVVKKIFRKYGLPMWALKAFAESWDDQNLEEDLENVQSEDAKKLEDPEKDPIKGELEEECDKEESLNEKAIDPALKGQKPKKVDKFEYSMSNDAVKRVADIIYNEMEESDFDLLNDIGFNAYINKDPEAIKQVKELFKKYGLPMWALKVFCEAWDDQNESLNEGIENLSLDTDDTHMEMSADDDGKVTVVTEPIHDEEVVEVEDEMIAPLDADEIDEIDNNEEQSAEEVAIEDESPEEDEFEIDDFDEESFDEIGESYLHRVYENVNSFNTTGVRYEKGKLTVEGLIKFNSGKEKNTEFIFENFRLTKRGKIMTEGMNDTFSKSSKAFILKGTLADKRFVSESLTYSYNVRQLNESNESEVIRVYGRAVATK